VNYIPAADLRSYTLIIVQKDVADIDRDKDKTETVDKALGVEIY